MKLAQRHLPSSIVTAGIAALICSPLIICIAVELCYYFRPFANTGSWNAIRDLFRMAFELTIKLGWFHVILALASVWGFYGISRGIETRRWPDRIFHAALVILGLVALVIIFAPSLAGGLMIVNCLKNVHYRLNSSQYSFGQVLKPLLYLGSYAFWCLVAFSMAGLLRLAMLSCPRNDWKIMIYLSGPLIFFPMTLMNFSIFAESDGVGQLQCAIVTSYGVVNFLASGLGDVVYQWKKQDR